MNDYEQAILEVAKFLKSVEAYENLRKVIASGVISVSDIKVNPPNIHTFISDLKTKYKIERI